jgi:hypothetical protein
MGIFDTFNRSVDITKKSFHIMMADKEIVLFPILATIFSVIFFAVMAVPFLLTSFMTTMGLDQFGDLPYYVVVFIFYLGVSFIATFFNVAVVYCAKKRFDGGDPTFSEGLNEAFKRIHLIFMWAMVSATVGLILRLLENAASRSKNYVARFIGSIIVSILGAAWSIASLFVVPAIVFNNLGPFAAVKLSIDSVKKTWGESLVREFGLGMVQFLFIMLGVLIFLVPAFLLLVTEMVTLALIAGGLFVIYIAIVFLLFSTADTIYNTALFMYASTGKIPSVYPQAAIQDAFKKK